MMIQPKHVVSAFREMASALEPGATGTKGAVGAASGLARQVGAADQGLGRALDVASDSFVKLGAGRTTATFHAAQVDMFRAASAAQHLLDSADQAALGAALRHHFPAG